MFAAEIQNKTLIYFSKFIDSLKLGYCFSFECVIILFTFIDMIISEIIKLYRSNHIRPIPCTMRAIVIGHV